MILSFPLKIRCLLAELRLKWHLRTDIDLRTCEDLGFFFNIFGVLSNDYKDFDLVERAIFYSDLKLLHK